MEKTLRKLYQLFINIDCLNYIGGSTPYAICVIHNHLRICTMQDNIIRAGQSIQTEMLVMK